MKQEILIAEDDADISGLLKRILETAGYETRQAYSGTEALLCFEKKQPDLVLLDLMLPGMTGEALLQTLRDGGCDLPVLVLSARAALRDKVALLKNGADDYITKPFEPEEVAARVEAALRRRGRREEGERGEPVFTYKNMKLYPDGRKVLVSGKPLSLTAYEYEILYLFIQNPEKVYSRERLYEQIWKGGYYGENNTVNVHISNLRRKIKEADAGEGYIQTVYGIGFKLESSL
nr:response regulator transcription factor [uncultured Eisenbergiella sp.]